MSIQIKGDLNKANSDYIKYKKWELKVVTVIILAFLIGVLIGLPLIYKPLLG